MRTRQTAFLFSEKVQFYLFTFFNDDSFTFKFYKQDNLLLLTAFDTTTVALQAWKTIIVRYPLSVFVSMHDSYK